MARLRSTLSASLYPLRPRCERRHSALAPKAEEVASWKCAHCDTEAEGGVVGLEHVRRHLQQLREEVGRRGEQEEAGLRMGASD